MAHALVSLLLLAASATAPRTFDVLPGSTISYHLVHRFHEVTGVAKAVEGKARMLPDGTVQVMLRAPIESFDSGNSNRDAHMREVTGSGGQPYVSFKGVGKGTVPDHFPSEMDVPLQGELTLKTPRPTQVDAHVKFASADRADVTAKFPVSLEEHQVERPSLMFVKVDDQIQIEVKLELGVEP
jgi:YceI-like domain